MKAQKTLTILYIIFTIMVLTGTYMRISHYSFWAELSFVGFAGGIIVMVYENMTLKKRIKELEQNIK